MGAAAIACAGVTVSYATKRVLDVPAFEVAAGETMAIIGPNGAGKSTLLGVLGLTLPPTTGRVLIDGAPADGLAARRRVVTQLQESLLLDGTVAWNVALPLRVRRVAAAAVAARVARWMALFGIEALARRHVRGLSGGEARRTCLARAFAVEPDALLIDEPLAGVDAPFREEILVALATALAERRWTTLMVTHDLVEGLRLAGRLAILVGGRIRQIGRPEEVLAAPADPDVARLVGVDTFVAGVAEGDGRVRVGAVSVPAAGAFGPDAAVWLAVRPEEVRLSPDGAPGALPATVVELRPRGATTAVILDVGFRLTALALPATVEALALRPGRRVSAHVRATAIRRTG